jgi:endonuclease/exonuclease/phosphatase family metal-dependent hydrolase
MCVPKYNLGTSNLIIRGAIQMRKLICLLFLSSTFPVIAQTEKNIEIGTFNIRFFPCNEDGDMMTKYNVQMRYPPKGAATDTSALFDLIRNLDLEILGVQEIVDPPLFGAMAKRHLGDHFEFIYAPSNGWQKVGFLYNSDKVQLIGSPQIHNEVTLGKPDRLRPAFHGYFKALPDGFDFHVIVVHLKASPRGYDQRKEQWHYLETILAGLPEDDRKDADIILLGDFNNVSDDRYDEFLPVMQQLNFFWIGSEQQNLKTSYWRPDWSKPEIQSSMIDQIVMSDDATIEYIERSTKTAGLCAAGDSTITGDFPDYYLNISDHCPVYSSFRAFPDDD